MVENLLPIDRSWLERFFSGRNALKWQSIVTESASPGLLEQVLPWISSFADPELKFPIVLPVFDGTCPIQWYGIASNETEANALAQELTAFIGPSFSNFKGYRFEPDLKDEIEQSLAERFGRFVFRFEPEGEADQAAIIKALRVYLNLLRRRPLIPDRTQRPFGKIRADFDRALLVGNEQDAYLLRDELVRTGRLGSEQQKFLDIRLLAGLGHEYQLAHDYALIKSVLGLSLPPQTISDLVSSLYSAYIAEIENCGDDNAIIDKFRKEITDNFRELFFERKGVRNPSVLKAFMLYELTLAEPNQERCRAIINSYPLDDGRALVERWAQRLTRYAQTKPDLRESARQALADEEYLLALHYAFDALPEPWAYGALLRCAVELRDVETALKVLSVADSVPDTEQVNWSVRDLARLQQLRSEYSGSAEVPVGKIIAPEEDWLSWINYVEVQENDRPPLQLLEEVLPRWSVETYVFDPVRCRELSERIGNASGITEQTIRDAIPSLVEFFVERPSRPVRGFSPIYSMLIRLIAWNGMVSANELELSSSLMQALLMVAPSNSDYLEAVDAYTEILGANNSPANVDWALNASEVLILQPSPDAESRLRFFMTVVEMARTWCHRLQPVQFEMLSLLAKDYGCSGLLDVFPIKDSAPDEVCKSFDGLIGIYTLMESAGQRAQEILRKLLPHSRIELNSDHVATDKLKVLSANADIFIFAWKSSKHQAYYAVKNARGIKQTLLPLGKGTASIVSCVLSEIGYIN